jgi:hypothetical protein
MIEIKAPMKWESIDGDAILFLAGSIEMGAAEDWQQYVARELAETDTIVLNPRRDDWDSSWVQSIDNAQFREQVEWELYGQERADVVLCYFSPGTKAPITLMELGLFHKKMIVCCPKGFWRKGNVDIVCARYNVPNFASLDEAIHAAWARL